MAIPVAPLVLAHLSVATQSYGYPMILLWLLGRWPTSQLTAATMAVPRVIPMVPVVLAHLSVTRSLLGSSYGCSYNGSKRLAYTYQLSIWPFLCLFRWFLGYWPTSVWPIFAAAISVGVPLVLGVVAHLWVNSHDSYGYSPWMALWKTFKGSSKRFGSLLKALRCVWKVLERPLKGKTLQIPFKALKRALGIV